MISKLSEVLSSLEKAEWRELEKFVLMQTSKKTDVYELYQFLLKRKSKYNFRNGINDLRLEIFPEMKQKAYLNIQSKLFGICEKWLVYNYYIDHRLESDLKLLNIYNNRSMFKMADLTMKKVERSIASNEAYHLEKDYYKFKLYFDLYFSHNPIKKKSAVTLLEKSASGFLRYAQDLSLLFELEMFNTSLIEDHSFESLIKDLHKLQLRSHNSKNKQILIQLLNFLKKKDEEAFEIIYEELLHDHFDDDSVLQEIVYYYLFKFSQIFLLGKDLRYKRIANSLIQFGFEKKIILTNGKLSISTFQRILSFNLKHMSFESTATFLDDAKDLMQGTDVKDLLIYANALNHFYHDKLDNVLQDFQRINPNRFDLKFTVLIYEIFIMYKDQAIGDDVVLNKIQNFERSIRRGKTKISKKLHDGLLNALLLTKRMLKSKYKDIHIDMDDYKPLAGSLWFNKHLKQ